LYAFAIIVMVCTAKPKPICRQVCCGKNTKVEREEAISIGETTNPMQPGKLEVDEGAWGAMPHGRTQYE
jgi:hypothetical protein